MGDLERYPWMPGGGLPPVPVVTEPAQAPTTDVIAALQADLRYMVSHTAVMVHSSRPELEMLVNTPRGQIVPRGECKFRDGSTIEFQDIGMPQVGAPVMTVRDLMARVWSIAAELGLELAT